MTMSLDGGHAVNPRREPLPAVAASTITLANSALAQNGPAAVPPTAAAERGARLASGEEQARQAAEREKAAAVAAKASPPPRTGSYERRLTYENEQARTFLDVINPENDEVLMRYPPESLVEYLKQGPAGSDRPVTGRPAVNTEA